MKWTIFCLFLFFNLCAAEARPGAVRITAPENCVAGIPVTVKINPGGDLPASSFYRVDIKCRDNQGSAKIAMKTGVPESELVFPAPGGYICEIETGFVTKTSCAGATYTKLDSGTFSINVEATEN